MARADTPHRPLQPTRCRHCDRVLSLHERYAGGVCGDARCRRRELEADLAACRDLAGRALREPAAENVPIVVIPHRKGQAVPMPPERREALEAHLSGVARRVAEAPACPVDDADPAGCDVETAAAVCGVCAGFCCYHGATRSAFLDEATIARFAAAHPDLGSDQVVAAYLAHVPERHFEGSCVYHTEVGCSLPRPMRAQICNEYECRGLRDAGQHRGRRLFVVARHDNRIVRGAFVDGTEARAPAAAAPGPSR